MSKVLIERVVTDVARTYRGDAEEINSLLETLRNRLNEEMLHYRRGLGYRFRIVLSREFEAPPVHRSVTERSVMGLDMNKQPGFSALIAPDGKPRYFNPDTGELR